MHLYYYIDLILHRIHNSKVNQLIQLVTIDRGHISTPASEVTSQTININSYVLLSRDNIRYYGSKRTGAYKSNRTQQYITKYSVYYKVNFSEFTARMVLYRLLPTLGLRP